MAANYTSLCLEHSEHLCDFAGTWGSSINRIQVLKSQLQEGKDTIFFLWTVITRSPTSHLNPVFLCVAPLPTCSETQNQTWTSRLLVRKVRTSRCLRRMPSAGLTSTHLTRDPEARPPAERWEWPSWVFTIVLRKWSFFYIKMMTNINISLKKKKDKFPELIWCFFFFFWQSGTPECLEMYLQKSRNLHGLCSLLPLCNIPSLTIFLRVVFLLASN